MSKENNESLESLIKAFDAAAASVDGTFEQLNNARVVEQRVGRLLEGAYENIFQKGFVIENITDPSKIRTPQEVSRHVGGLFGHTEWDHEWFSISEATAASLHGQLVTSLGVSSPAYRSIYNGELTERQGFSVSFYHDSDQYSGALEAIQWRLPTKREIAAVGKLATTNA